MGLRIAYEEEVGWADSETLLPPLEVIRLERLMEAIVTPL